MSGSDNPPATLPNPKIDELNTALRLATVNQPGVDGRVDDVATAMQGGAWHSTNGLSDAFNTSVAAQKTALHNATQGCIDNVRHALSTTPKTIPNPNAKQK